MLHNLEQADKAAAEVQKTPNRVTLELLQSRIEHYEYHRPSICDHMVVCFAMLDNGFVIIGWSKPTDPANFDVELGTKFAYEDVIRQMWQLEAYLLHERLSESSS